jgi:hypothetical protein
MQNSKMRPSPSGAASSKRKRDASPRSSGLRAYPLLMESKAGSNLLFCRASCRKNAHTFSGRTLALEQVIGGQLENDHRDIRGYAFSRHRHGGSAKYGHAPEYGNAKGYWDGSYASHTSRYRSSEKNSNLGGVAHPDEVEHLPNPAPLKHPQSAFRGRVRATSVIAWCGTRRGDSGKETQRLHWCSGLPRGFAPRNGGC